MNTYTSSRYFCYPRIFNIQITDFNEFLERGDVPPRSSKQIWKPRHESTNVRGLSPFCRKLDKSCVEACQNSTSRHLGPSLTNHESCHGSGRNAGIKQHSACPQARFWQDHIFLHLVEFFSILRLRPVTVCIRSGWPIFNLNWIYALQVPQLEVFFPDSSRLLPSRALEPNLFQVFFFELNHIYF